MPGSLTGKVRWGSLGDDDDDDDAMWLALVLRRLLAEGRGRQFVKLKGAMADGPPAKHEMNQWALWPD